MDSRLVVLIPFYGKVDALSASMESLAAETYPHDVIVVDDGNPQPVDVLQNSRVTVLRHPRNAGITAALNTGLQFAIDQKYEFIARLDAGDLIVSGRLAKQVAFLQRNPNCKLVGGHAVFTDETGDVLFRWAPPCRSEELLRTLHRRCCFLHPTVMFRADVFRAVGLYRNDYPSAEDFDLFFRIAKRFETANVRDIVLRYEVSRASISSRRRKEQLRSKLRIVTANFNPGLIESYMGVAEATLGCILPRSVTTMLNVFRSKWEQRRSAQA